MIGSSKSGYTEYIQIVDEELDDSQDGTPPQRRLCSTLSSPIRLILSILLVILTVCGFTHWLSRHRPSSPTVHEPVTTRREWRTLTKLQKHEYIAAVRCLKTMPSRLGLNHTLYDDFPYIHFHVGEYVHDAAPFLAWHRYFVHIYESALKEECGYRGSMPFWDWQLDWQNLTNAPIWDDEHGFGTSGVAEKSKSAILNGHCVVNGPFKDFVIPYLDTQETPHCLSRGFAQGKELQKQAEMVSPNEIESLLALHSYDAFNLGLEHGPHLAIPRFVRGDFLLLTAPSDPVFFLHHTQLDRLWWKWQTLHPGISTGYDGVTAHHSQERASLDDVLRMGGLAPDVAVAEIIDTRNGLLRYRY